MKSKKKRRPQVGNFHIEKVPLVVGQGRQHLLRQFVKWFRGEHDREIGLVKLKRKADSTVYLKVNVQSKAAQRAILVAGLEAEKSGLIAIFPWDRIEEIPRA